MGYKINRSSKNYLDMKELFEYCMYDMEEFEDIFSKQFDINKVIDNSILKEIIKCVKDICNYYYETHENRLAYGYSYAMECGDYDYLLNTEYYDIESDSCPTREQYQEMLNKYYEINKEAQNMLERREKELAELLWSIKDSKFKTLLDDVIYCYFDIKLD